MDQVRPGQGEIRSIRLVDQIHPRHPDPPKIISRCSQSGSHMTIIIQNFTLVSLISITTPYPAGLPFRAMVLSYLIHLTTHSTPHCLRCWKIFLTIGTICGSPTCPGMRFIFLEHHWMAWSLSGWLDIIELAPPLC